MRVVKLFVFAFLAVFLSQFANAQITEPVKWEFLIEDIADDEVNLVFKAKIDEAWHLYGQNFPEGGPIPLLFEIEDNENFEFEGVVQELSELIEEYDDIFEINVSYFSGEALFKQNILLKTSEPFVIRGEVNGQACQDNGMCVPISADFAFALNGANLEDFAQDKEVEKSVKNETPVLIKENSYLDDSEKENIFWFFLIAFVSGLIAILTPCVFPMIPMTISFFMKEDNKTKAKFNAFAFGISIILIYTLIGSVLAIIFGPAIANWLSTHWIPNVLFFLIFMIFAASFFGAFDIVLPSWLVNKSDSKADRGGLIGAFFMALTLVLVSFSCTGPIVGTILVSSFGGSILKPIIGMFGFSLAFALPFTLLALFPRWLKSMPKSGGWLNTVKVVLGFIEVALGFKFLSIADQTYHWGILDRQVYLAIWIVTFTLLGFYLLGKLRFKHDDELKYISVGRLSMSMLSFVFVLYMIPGMWGAPLKALSGYLPPITTHYFNVPQMIDDNSQLILEKLGYDPFTEACADPKYKNDLQLPLGLVGYFDWHQAFECAKNQNKPVFIDFTGHGCVNCREMETAVWSDKRVLDYLRNDFVILPMYVDDKTIQLPEEEWFVSSNDGKLKKYLGEANADIQIVNFDRNSQPYYVLVSPDGVVLAPPRAYSLNVNEFVDFLELGLKNFEEMQEE